MSKEKPRILILDQADFIGGAELFVSDLLNSLNYEEFEIHLATSFNPAYLDLIPEQVLVHRFSPPSLKVKKISSYFQFLKSVKELNKIITENNIDIVHSNTIRTHLINSLSKANKKIWFVHDFTFPKFFCKLLASKPDQILCCSKIVKKDIAKKIKTKHHHKLKTIYNGVKLKAYPTKSKNKHPKIGLVGRIDWWKGQKEFILAAQEVLKTIPKVKFYLMGSPNYKDPKTTKYFTEIKELVKNLNLEKSIIFSGYISNILKEIAQLDLLVHASTQAEPFGRVIIEAMSVHTPVIASNLGGTHEIIINRENGLLVSPTNIPELSSAILEILQNPNQAQKYTSKAYEQIENKFTLNHSSYKIQNIWHRLNEQS